MKIFNSLRFTASVFSLAVLISIVGCKKEDTGHDPFRSKINIKCLVLPSTDFDADTVKITSPAAGQDLKLMISASQDVSWKTSIIESYKPFVFFSPEEGSGYSSTTLTVRANTSNAERKLEVLFYDSLNKKARKFIITQPAL